MSLLIARDLAKSYGIQQVLASVSVTLGPGDKVALVGRNGSGKSTLLRLIAREETPDAGSIALLPGVHVGYLAQDPDLSGGETLLAAVAHAMPRVIEMGRRLRELEALLDTHPPDAATLAAEFAELHEEYAHAGGPAYDGRVKATLAGLGFREADFELPIPALSGGQRTRAGLCMLLLQEPDLLLLDEPTNHLDLPAVEWLEENLSRTRSAVFLVSHDRYFLDRVATRVVEVEDGRSLNFPGNYTAYARQREERLVRLQEEYEKKVEQKEKLEEYIRRNHAGQLARMAKSREKALARMQIERPRIHRPELKVSLNAALRSGDEVLRVERLAKGFEEKPLFDGLELVVHRGDRIGIVGPNGSGKSTFLRILVGQMTPDAGAFEFGTNVEAAYFAQDLSSAMPENTVLDEIMDAGAGTYGEARNILARFLFFGDDVFKRVGDLSGGERNRVALARLLLSHANLLLLDEPTNHLDIAARDHLEEALLGFGGTILFSSHDRYLLNRVATRILEVSGGQARLYDGDYDHYHRRKEREALLAEQARVRAERAAPAPTPAPVRAERGVRPQDLRRAVKTVEQRIADTEARVHELGAFLADSSNYGDMARIQAASQEYDALNASLPELLAEWERLAEAVEAVGAKG